MLSECSLVVTTILIFDKVSKFDVLLIFFFFEIINIDLLMKLVYYIGIDILFIVILKQYNGQV
jgi:hypothetical protein